MIPRLDTVPEEFLADLRGLSPRHESNGRWVSDLSDDDKAVHDPDAVPLVKRRWQCDSCVDFDQWTLFQETGCFAVPCWIIQGDKGGHRWRLSGAELGALEQAGIKSPELPLPGDLPYADYDQRTYRKLAEFDRLRRWKESSNWDDRMQKTQAGLWVTRERVDQEQEYNLALMKWLDDQIETAVSDMSRSELPGFSELPQGDGYYNADEDGDDREFVEETATALEE